MKDEGHIELSPDEKAALQRAWKDREPGRLLEEHTMRAMHAEGLLRERPVGVRRRSLVLVAGVAAAVALFVSGFAVGQWSGVRTTAGAMAVRQETALETALAVQRAGSAYVAALEALARVADSSGNGATAQGREVALATLTAAANELIELSPDEPVAESLRQALRSVASADQPASRERLVWF